MKSIDAKQLYEKYGFLIYNKCLNLLGNEEEAKDGLQDIMLKLVRQYPKFKDPEHVVPWIYTVVKNYCFNILKKRKKFVDNSVLDRLPENDSGEISLEDREIISIVLSHHNKKVQDAVYYTYVEKLNQEEIQKLIGQSPATVRRNLKRFKESLPGIRKRLGLS